MRSGSWRSGRAGEIVKVYVDNDRSVSQRKPRREYLRMRADLAGGIASRVLVWHTDRLHRRNAELRLLSGIARCPCGAVMRAARGRRHRPLPVVYVRCADRTLHVAVSDISCRTACCHHAERGCGYQDPATSAVVTFVRNGWDVRVVWNERRQQWWWNAWRELTSTELSGFADSREAATVVRRPFRWFVVTFARRAHETPVSHWRGGG
jgi:hypothetical protein